MGFTCRTSSYPAITGKQGNRCCAPPNFLMIAGAASLSSLPWEVGPDRNFLAVRISLGLNVSKTLDLARSLPDMPDLLVFLQKPLASRLGTI